jgi:hypothetical protein
MSINCHEWHSAGTDEPGDQQRDLSFGPFWAEIGPDHPDGWTWIVMDFDQDNDIVGNGKTATEKEAKAAVSQWEAAHKGWWERITGSK